MVGFPSSKSQPTVRQVMENQPFPWSRSSFWAKLNVTFVEQYYQICRGDAVTANCECTSVSYLSIRG
jgi:hypothetical protein